MRRILRRTLAAMVLAGSAPAVAAAPPAVDFDFADDAARETRTLSGAMGEGHLTLRWPVPEDAPAEGTIVVYQLQRAADASFEAAVIHHDGPATTVFVSGLADGPQHFRVRAGLAPAADADPTDPRWGPWSDAAVFTVQHQSMRLAWTLFGIGGFLFVALVVIIVGGARAAGTPAPAPAPEPGAAGA